VVESNDHRAAPVTPGPLVLVEDPDDPRLDLYRNLTDPSDRARLDADRPVCVVEGRLAVARLLTSNYRIRSLLVDDHQVRTAHDIVAAARAQGAPVYVGSRSAVARTVGFALHRGVVALADRPSPADVRQLLAGVVARARPEKGPPVVAVLEGLNDHENIGAVFRNAAAFGVAGVLLDPTCADPLYRRSIRVSVGYALHVPFARLDQWPTGLDQVRRAGLAVVALAPHPSGNVESPVATLTELKATLSGSDRPAGVALFIGAEGHGLSAAVLNAADDVVTIPMADGVDSLNVATAAAIAFHALADL
jgi:tRNA G18 (ribose-2'-O)-methylase SpoU